jgi:hypothetical protein
LSSTIKSDVDPAGDLGDVQDDIAEIGKENKTPVPWAWFQEGYDREVTDQAGPLDANGSHASYVTHHNGPQYFGYVGRNPAMRAAHLHGLSDFFEALDHRALPIKWFRRSPRWEVTAALRSASYRPMPIGQIRFHPISIRAQKRIRARSHSGS